MLQVPEIELEGGLDWVRPREAAKLLGVGPKTLQKWRADRRHLPFSKLGGGIYYERREVMDLLERSRVEVER